MKKLLLAILLIATPAQALPSDEDVRNYLEYLAANYACREALGSAHYEMAKRVILMELTAKSVPRSYAIELINSTEPIFSNMPSISDDGLCLEQINKASWKLQ